MFSIADRGLISRNLISRTILNLINNDKITIVRYLFKFFERHPRIVLTYRIRYKLLSDKLLATRLLRFVNSFDRGRSWGPSSKVNSGRNVNTRDQLGTRWIWMRATYACSWNCTSEIRARARTPRRSPGLRFRIPTRIWQIECDVIMDAALAVLPARPRWELAGKMPLWKSLPATTFARKHSFSTRKHALFVVLWINTGLDHRGIFSAATG